MLRRHAVEALAASAVALCLTLVIAAPVVLTPSERIFGADIVGWHHDPFTVMQQFARPLRLGVYSQPVTDLMGAEFARVVGPVAAYNWLVLLSFPLSAAAAYLLARHLALSPSGAMLAALLFTFSPFHVAHAAYHPHIAQTQWLPLYLLALWRGMDETGVRAIAFLTLATVAVVWSNFYGGLIAAVITPFAIGVYWFARARFMLHAGSRLAVTVGTLALLALSGMAFVWWTAPGLVANRAGFAFAREDLFRYSAKWWGYLVPPVAHPLLGGVARRIWIASSVDVGLLEQQVSLGWSVVALGLVAVYGCLARDRRSVAEASVPILAAVAMVAMVCSLSPERSILGVTVMRPSALLYPIVPMFRSYARFGVIVQLMAALLAAVGAGRLFAATGPARVIGVSLVVLAIAEYAVWPPALSRDVLPTAAHRWVMRQSPGLLVLDCAATPPNGFVSSLTLGRIRALDHTFADCVEPGMAGKLSAAGYTHVLVRDRWERQWLREHGDAEGFRMQAHYSDADILAVTPGEPLVYTQQIVGLWPREHDHDTTWRWMGTDASWTIVTPTSRAWITLAIDLSAFHVRRPLVVRLDGDDERILSIDQGPGLRTYRIGPLALSAGPHVLTLHSAAPATVADEVLGNGDHRALSFSIGAWKWLVS
ncbi:MAG: hypothetical protein ABJA98_28585 [Acidobacteriota bacterium]